METEMNSGIYLCSCMVFNRIKSVRKKKKKESSASTFVLVSNKYGQKM